MVSLSFENVSRSELRSRARTLMNDALGILTLLGDEDSAAATLQNAIERVSPLPEDAPLPPLR